MMARKHATALIFLMVLTISVSGGCNALTPEPAALTTEEVSADTDNLLKAKNDNNYEAFTRDFDETMTGVFTEAEFLKIQEMVQETSGNYISCEEPKLLNQDGLAVYRFPCTFEEEEVTVSTIYSSQGDVITGLYCDSPNLRDYTP